MANVPSTPTTVYKDLSIAHTEEEILEAREMFKNLPTYNSDTDTVSTSVIRELVQGLRFDRTDEQIAAYKSYWDVLYKGNIPWNAVVEILRTIHSTVEYFTNVIKAADKDGNGFIDEHEFEEICKDIKVQDAKYANLTYEQFLLEADANKDGKLSVQECVEWVQKNFS